MLKNIIFYKNSQKMSEINDNSIDLIVTSPPYFNIKDYSKDGKQKNKHSEKKIEDIGKKQTFNNYLEQILKVWKECYRVLKPNGKLCVNLPLVPLLKKENKTKSHNRYIYDLQSQNQNLILSKTKFQLLDLYIWNRTNSSKKLMFGSYPYPTNFYAQNSVEFITVFVKPGKPKKQLNLNLKKKSKLSQKEWIEYTKQIWNIPIPNKNDKGFGKHPAITPIEIANRCIKLYSWVDAIVLDPFAGSGTTLLAAKKLNRNFIGYELYKHYKKIIDFKVYDKK